MRRIILPILALALVGFAFLTSPAGAGPGCTEVRGRVTDAATNQPVAGQSVEVWDGATPVDGLGTNLNGRWSICLGPAGDPDGYTFKFVSDEHRTEWYHNQPNATAATPVDVSGIPADGPIIVNESLVPKGRVIAGRVTNVGGVGKHASVGIFRQTSSGWVSIDGIANNAGNWWYEFRVPGPGRYRVNACVDSHWCRFATSATHLSAGRIVTLGVSSTFVNDVHIRVPYCHAAPDFCVPPGFLS